ncbi:hypothetical protein QQP08_001074 [Theobroma cacao]|nr:hypothetical protein QQP08_001074 [Theobroma cacao]
MEKMTLLCQYSLCSKRFIKAWKKHQQKQQRDVCLWWNPDKKNRNLSFLSKLTKFVPGHFQESSVKTISQSHQRKKVEDLDTGMSKCSQRERLAELNCFVTGPQRGEQHKPHENVISLILRSKVLNAKLLVDERERGRGPLIPTPKVQSDLVFGPCRFPVSGKNLPSYVLLLCI